MLRSRTNIDADRKKEVDAELHFRHYAFFIFVKERTQQKCAERFATCMAKMPLAIGRLASRLYGLKKGISRYLILPALGHQTP